MSGGVELGGWWEKARTQKRQTHRSAPSPPTAGRPTHPDIPALLLSSWKNPAKFTVSPMASSASAMSRTRLRSSQEQGCVGTRLPSCCCGVFCVMDGGRVVIRWVGKKGRRPNQSYHQKGKTHVEVDAEVLDGSVLVHHVARLEAGREEERGDQGCGDRLCGVGCDNHMTYKCVLRWGFSNR